MGDVARVRARTMRLDMTFQYRNWRDISLCGSDRQFGRATHPDTSIEGQQ
jgi:hypothetical protein